MWAWRRLVVLTCDPQWFHQAREQHGKCGVPIRCLDISMQMLGIHVWVLV